MASVLLFVYGSLKRGGRHHAELAASRFVGEAQTAPGYALTTLGEYWALVTLGGERAPPAPDSADGADGDSGDSGDSVRGELFEVPEVCLAGLDEFEGHGYERGKVRLATEHSCGFREALAYFWKAR